MSFKRRDTAKLNETRKMRAAGLSPAHASRLAESGVGMPSGLLVGGGLLGLAGVLGTAMILLQPSTAPSSQIVAGAVQPDVDVPITNAAEPPAPDAVQAPVTPEKIAAPAEVPAPQPVVQPVLEVAMEQPAPTDPKPVAATDCVAELGRVVTGQSIYFDLGSAAVNPSAVPVLERIATAGAECPDARILISGHSDSTGDDLINLQLSWERADNTLNAIETLGLNTERFETAGFGARAPAEQGSDSEDPINRRVSFRVLRAEGPALR